MYKSFTRREDAEAFMLGVDGGSTGAATISSSKMVEEQPVASSSGRNSTRKRVIEARQVRAEGGGGSSLGTTAGESGSNSGSISNARILATTSNSLDEALIVYSDGACKGNGKPGSVAGLGVYFGEGDERNLSERCPGVQTNNRAELIAIIRSIELSPKSAKRLTVKTDSRYSIDCVTKYLPGWIRNNFILSTGQPVKNREVIEYLAELIRMWERRGPGARIELVYVRGHSGEPGNEAADGLANLGVLLPERPKDEEWADRKSVV